MAPAHADPTNFHPVVTANLGYDAARQPSPFSLKITQQDGEEQIGAVRIALPRSPGYTVHTDVPGDGAQIGTIHVVLYTDPHPGGTLTIDGTLNDDNRPDCAIVGVKQCIKAILNVAGQTVTASLVINETTDFYTIVGDLAPTWNDPNVKAIHAGLAELSTTLWASANGQTVFKNPDVGGYFPLSYSLRSVPPTANQAGSTPDCGETCTVPLYPNEYAPTPPWLVAPANGAAVLAGSAVTFNWAASFDANGDTVTYQWTLDGATVDKFDQRSAITSLEPGRHTWSVTASDGHGLTGFSGESTVIAIDPATPTLRFLSVANGDVLYVSPSQSAFVYVLPSGAQYGAVTSSASGPNGYILFSGAFQLLAGYDAVTKTAVGTFLGANDTRPFIDPPN